MAVSGGTSPYSYNWTKNGAAYATTQNITGLSTGNYKLIVTDASSCQAVIPGAALPVSITASGYTDDIVADGTGATTQGSTSVGCDATPGNVFIADGFQSITPGMPSTNEFMSATTGSLLYKLAGYSGNNAISIISGSATATTLTFSSQAAIAYSNLYVAASCGSGSETIDYSVNFSDATTQTGSFTVLDWYWATGNTGHALQPVRRASRDANTPPSTIDLANFTLWEYSIPVNAGNQTKNVSSITFSYNGGGNSGTRANIMAVAGISSPTGGIVPLSDGPQSGGTPAVTITSDAPGTQFCSGQSITYTANAKNGGTAPAYQWTINGVNQAGATSVTFLTAHPAIIRWAL